MKIWIGELETRGYTFQSYGLNFDQARITLMRAWNLHRQYTGATLTWKSLWDGGDATVREVLTAVPYRDREKL